jgi:hypothetical protein
VPPPNPLKQQKLRGTLRFDGDKIADGLNTVVIEVDDEAACRPAGRKYQVLTSIFPPVDSTEFDAETEARWQSMLNRLDVLARLDSGRLTAQAAAELMKITPRQAASWSYALSHRRAHLPISRR